VGPLRGPGSSLAVVLACTLLGCGGGDDDKPDIDELIATLLDCGAYTHTPCDIFDADCQQKLATIAACQWGGPGTAPDLTSARGG